MGTVTVPIQMSQYLYLGHRIKQYVSDTGFAFLRLNTCISVIE